MNQFIQEKEEEIVNDVMEESGPEDILEVSESNEMESNASENNDAQSEKPSDKDNKGNGQIKLEF